MARRGRFGRRPRASGNLTALVAQLFREQQQAEDRVMFDAWQNGGQVDGKPVTDGRLRGYIAARRDGFTKDDPLYDDWNNRLTQIDFKIGEDKIQLAFQQGKVGAGAVASFYRGQLTKIPKDSAFYRDVAGRAAQWAKAVGSAARSGASRRLASHVQSKSDAADKVMANAAAISDIVHRAAVRAGLINENDAVTEADATRLQELFNAGITGPRGTTVSMQDWRESLMSVYHAFDQKIAANQQLNRGTKTLQKDKAKFFQDYVLGVNAIDDRAKYEMARDVWLEAVGGSQGDPGAVIAANNAYKAALGKILRDAGAATGTNANPDEFVGALQNEVNALDGKYTGPGVVDIFKRSDAGDFDGKVGSGDDTASTVEGVKAATADSKALQNGTAYYGQGDYGGPMGVHYYQPGSELDPFGKHGLGPDSQYAVVNVDGAPKQVVLKGKPVQSYGLTTADGQAVNTVTVDGQQVNVENLTSGQVRDLISSGQYTIDEKSGGTVGYVFTQGGKTTYGVLDPATGDLRFTDKNPFGGAFGLAGSGYALVTGTQVSDNGDVQNMNPPVHIGTNADTVLVDPTISPNDLRRLGGNIEDKATGAELAAIADKRQQQHRDEITKLHTGRDTSPAKTSLPGPFGQVRDTIDSTVQNLVRAALGVADANKPEQFAPLVRDTDRGPLVPPVAKAVPPVAPPPTAIKNTSGAKAAGGKDDTYKPPPKNTSGAKSQGGKDDVYKPPPPPPTGKGGGGTSIAS